MAVDGSTDDTLTAAQEAANKEGTVSDIVANEKTAVENEATPATTSGGITLPPGDTPVGAAGGGGLGTTGTTAATSKPPATSPPSSPPATGGGGGGGDIGVGIGGTGIGITPAAIGAALDGYLSDDDVGIEQFINMSGDPPTVEDAWNYLVDQVDGVFTDLENTLTEIEGAGFGVDVDLSVAEVAAGVTADIVDADAIGLAIGFLIAGQMAGWVITHVANGFPNPSIFGWHPLNFIHEGLVTVGNELQTLSEDTINALAGLFIQPVRQLTGLFQRSTNAHATQQNQNARIVQDTVPTAKQDAITAAEAYTDNAIAGVNNAAGQALVDLPASTTLDEARALVSESTQYDTLSWKMIGVGAAAMVQADEYADTLKNQTAQDIANSQAAAEQAAQTAVANLQTQLVTRLTGDENSLSALATTVNTTIPNEIETATNNAIATENQQLTAATNTIEQQIAAIQGQIQTLNTQITSANQTIATAQSNITNLENEDTTDESAIASQQATIAAAQTEIATSTTAISDLYTQMTSISATLAPIQATQALQTSQLSDITTDVDVALPTLLATISATLNSVKTQVDTCTVDTCDPQSPNYYKNILMDLLGALTAAAEIGFIAEAVKDPVGTATALAPLLDSIGGSGIDALDALLSL